MGGGGGSIYYAIIKFGWVWVKILWYNILTPPPSKNIQEQYFVNGIQWQLSFSTQNIYISQTILFHGWHFFLMGCGGSIYYCIIYWPPPPPTNIQERFFCKWNPVTTKLQHFKHLHITDNTIQWLTFLFYGRGVNILWYNKLTHPPLQNIQEQYFVNEIQWQLRFKTQKIYISQPILFGGWHFSLMGCVFVCVGGQYIMV